MTTTYFCNMSQCGLQWQCGSRFSGEALGSDPKPFKRLPKLLNHPYLCQELLKHVRRLLTPEKRIWDLH